MTNPMPISDAVRIAEARANRFGGHIYSRRARAMLERGWIAFKSHNWAVVLSGFVEPVFYLAAFGFGIGKLIGGVTDGSGHEVSYAQYIAPALLATSAMNGAIYDSTWNVFFKMHFGKVYQTMMATSLGPLDIAIGEISWALMRGFTYAVGFMVVVTPMGLIPSWWGLLAIPAAVLIAFGFASIGMGVTSYMSSFQQMDWINFFMLPIFLLSGTFFPLSVYPEWLQHIIMALPLWQAVELIRSLTFGQIGWPLVWHAVYFIVAVAGGMVFTTKRLTALFMR